MLPACGCDVCDEDPHQLADVLRTQAYALVEGGLWERVRRGVGGSWYETRLIGVGVNGRREGPLTRQDAREARRSGFAAPVLWAPWPRRPLPEGDAGEAREPGSPAGQPGRR